MESLLLRHEPAVRLSCFLGIFAIIAVAELMAPRRQLQESKVLRWTNNLSLVIINTAIVRALLPFAAVGVALFAAERGIGLFNLLHVPHLVAIVLSVVALDLAIYLQHRGFHAVASLWRLHRVHHADLDFDVTTGVRFHSIEIGLSMLIKFAVILALGPPALAVLLFEVLLNASSIFNHSNVRIPVSMDGMLRCLVVTPDMHRVHHSIEPHETNSNFGFILPWWDWLGGTYRTEPKAGHEGMKIGTEQFRLSRDLRLDRMLLQPFRSEQAPKPLVGSAR